MTHSANEITSLAARAARGAGAPPAQAARFGQAAAQHIAAARDEETLMAALEALPTGPILSLALDPSADDPLADSYRSSAALPSRLLPSQSLLDHLTKLAHRTYVPATEASRRSGAGAGLSDND